MNAAGSTHLSSCLQGTSKTTALDVAGLAAIDALVAATLGSAGANHGSEGTAPLPASPAFAEVEPSSKPKQAYRVPLLRWIGAVTLFAAVLACAVAVSLVSSRQRGYFDIGESQTP